MQLSKNSYAVHDLRYSFAGDVPRYRLEWLELELLRKLRKDRVPGTVGRSERFNFVENQLFQQLNNFRVGSVWSFYVPHDHKQG